MIYIFRHQEGGYHTNCLSLQGEKNTHTIATYFTKQSRESEFFKTVYTIIPIEYKHIRPIQTATSLCTHLNKKSSFEKKFSVMACWNHTHLVQDLESMLSSSPWLNVIIVWHHAGMQSLVDALLHRTETKSLDWPPDNYDGCVRIDMQAHMSVFDEHYFRSNKSIIPTKLFRMLTCNLIY